MMLFCFFHEVLLQSVQANSAVAKVIDVVKGMLIAGNSVQRKLIFLVFLFLAVRAAVTARCACHRSAVAFTFVLCTVICGHR